LLISVKIPWWLSVDRPAEGPYFQLSCLDRPVPVFSSRIVQYKWFIVDQVSFQDNIEN
jgi:hypothetical protein